MYYNFHIIIYSPIYSFSIPLDREESILLQFARTSKPQLITFIWYVLYITLSCMPLADNCVCLTYLILGNLQTYNVFHNNHISIMFYQFHIP